MIGRRLSPTEPGEFWISLPALAAWLKTAFASVKQCEECKNLGRTPCPSCTRGQAHCECDCGQLCHEVTCEACDGRGSVPCLVCNAEGPRVQTAQIIGVTVDRDIILAALEGRSDHLIRARPLGQSLALRGRTFRIVIPPVRLTKNTEVVAARAWAHEQIPLPLREAPRKAG